MAREYHIGEAMTRWSYATEGGTDKVEVDETRGHAARARLRLGGSGQQGRRDCDRHPRGRLLPPGCDVCTGACVPDVPAFFDSSSCPAGERCTTEDGVCDPVTLCDADGACVDVCAGTCVTDEEAPQTCLWGEACPFGVCSLQQLGCDPRYAPFCVGVCLEVAVCLSDDSCAAGERCTTDDGACDPVALCDADGGRADVCGGTCVPDSPPPSCVTGEECPSGLCSLQHFGCDPRFAPFCLGLCLEPESCFTDDNCAAGAL